MYLFLPYSLNDSQTIRSTIHFSTFLQQLFCVMLICGDCTISRFHLKQSAVLLCVQPLPGKQLFLMLQKLHLVATSGQAIC